MLVVLLQGCPINLPLYNERKAELRCVESPELPECGTVAAQDLRFMDCDRDGWGDPTTGRYIDRFDPVVPSCSGGVWVVPPVDCDDTDPVSGARLGAACPLELAPGFVLWHADSDEYLSLYEEMGFSTATSLCEAWGGSVVTPEVALGDVLNGPPLPSEAVWVDAHPDEVGVTSRCTEDFDIDSRLQPLLGDREARQDLRALLRVVLDVERQCLDLPPTGTIGGVACVRDWVTPNTDVWPPP